MMTQNRFTHLNEAGEASMVDVGDKEISRRAASAECFVHMKAETLRMILDGKHKKGDVFATCRIAGIMAAKKCADLIPLCHTLNLTSVKVDLAPVEGFDDRVHIVSRCRLDAKTGVEMEALTAVTVAALTLYDMCKAVDKGMHIEGTRLLEKTGGTSGHYLAEGYIPQSPPGAA